MYADPTSRGGILEPSGVVSVKYKARELIATAHRLDPKLQQLNMELEQAAVAKDATAMDRIKRAIASREDMLMNTIRQIAESFADLHDTPGRMVAKNVVTGTIPWKYARERFARRFQRRIAENRLCQRIDDILVGGNKEPLFTTRRPNLTARDRIRAWYETYVPGGDWSNDAMVYAFLTGQEGVTMIERELVALRQEHVQKKILELGSVDPDACLDAVMNLLGTLPTEKRAAFQDRLYGGLQKIVPSSTDSTPSDVPLDTQNPTPLVSFVTPFSANTSNNDNGSVSPLYF